MKEVFHFLNQMSPYLLLGFFLAGLMHVFIPSRLYTKLLSGNSFASIIRATLLGIPLPLCSCGVIPTAMSLRREGASKGATVAFLVATPQTGVDSIIATYSILGLPFAVLRPVAALCTALFSGQLVNYYSPSSSSETVTCESSTDSSESVSFALRIKKALHYAFVEMMKDIGKWLVLGLVLAALITLFVPADFFSVFKENTLVSMLMVLLLSIPMYLCATGSIPIAVALMLKGLSPGSALVLLMAGPASSIASILLINKVLGRKTMLLYLASIILGAIVFGLIVDYLLPSDWFTVGVSNVTVMAHHGDSWWRILCSVVLSLMLLNVFVWPHIRKMFKSDTAPEARVNSSPEGLSYRFLVKGMQCNHCCNSVEKALREIEGVREVVVDLSSKSVYVEGNVAKEPLVAAIQSLGYDVLEQP